MAGRCLMSGRRRELPAPVFLAGRAACPDIITFDVGERAPTSAWSRTTGRSSPRSGR